MKSYLSEMIVCLLLVGEIVLGSVIYCDHKGLCYEGGLTLLEELLKKNPVSPRYRKTNGLVYYWPFASPLMTVDVVSGVSLYHGHKVRVQEDRNNRPNMALSFRTGYYNIPSGNYFKTGNFTISAWIRPRKNNNWARVVDFGNGQFSDNILLAHTSGTSGRPYFQIWKGSTSISGLSSPNVLPLNQWTHLAVTLEVKSAKMFINGKLDCSGTASDVPNKITRTENYVGRSNWYQPPDNDPDTEADIDEIKIFDRALTAKQINFEMNNDMY